MIWTIRFMRLWLVLSVPIGGALGYQGLTAAMEVERLESETEVHVNDRGEVGRKFRDLDSALSFYRNRSEGDRRGPEEVLEAKSAERLRAVVGLSSLLAVPLLVAALACIASWVWVGVVCPPSLAWRSLWTPPLRGYIIAYLGFSVFATAVAGTSMFDARDAVVSLISNAVEAVGLLLLVLLFSGLRFLWTRLRSQGSGTPA